MIIGGRRCRRFTGGRRSSGPSTAGVVCSFQARCGHSVEGMKSRWLSFAGRECWVAGGALASCPLQTGDMSCSMQDVGVGSSFDAGTVGHLSIERQKRTLFAEN